KRRLPRSTPRVEYSLTKHGKAFLPIFLSIKEWRRSLPPPKEQ
ncbi:winged helix-turn-helix transcriptional regulator, partial [Methanobacterium sp.]